MKKLLSLILLTFTLAGLTSAQTKNAVINSRGLLWQISGNGLKSPSYLFGTYHLAGKSFIDSLGYVEAKLKTCKTVVGEVVVDSSAYAQLLPMMMLTNTSLDKLFTPAEFKLISSTMSRELHIDVSMYKTLKPAAIEIVIEGSIAPKTITATNPPMDIYFQTEGKKLHYQVMGLETMEFQAKLLLNSDMATQKRHLLYLVNHIAKERADMERSYSYYAHQDLQHLSELMNADDDNSQAEMDQLLKNRNLNWMTKLPAIMAANPTFIAVGSGHLVGQYGLINQLRLKGYKLTPVFN